LRIKSILLQKNSKEFYATTGSWLARHYGIQLRSILIRLRALILR
jgi:hypothetical protein